jgi:hypothetical protein
MPLTKEQEARLKAWFKQEPKHVCANCFYFTNGFCRVRQPEDVIRGANLCPDWKFMV